MPPVDKKQLSTWLNNAEAELVRAAAEADQRTVSGWIKKVLLEKLASVEASA